MRLRETPKVPYAKGLPMPLPLAAPMFLAYVDLSLKQIVLFDLSVDGAAGITVVKTEQTPVSAALSADGDSLCIGSSRGGLWIYDTNALLGAAAAGRAAGEPTELVQPWARQRIFNA